MTAVGCGGDSSGRISTEELQAALDDIVRTRDWPGMTAAAVFPDARPVAAASGLSDPATGTPMTTDSRMLAASIGKTFVAATVVALAEEGRLALDQPLAEWLADREWFDRLPNAHGMTIRHLLSHQSGLPDHVHAEAFRSAWSGGRAALAPEMLIGFVLDQSPEFSPGEGWAYSDTGYLLLGLVIEQATGRSYEHEVGSRFLAPLRLRDTGPSNTVKIENLATGLVSESSGLDLPRRTTGEDGTMLWNPGIEWTGGGLYSTSSDLARWGRALFTGRAIPMRGVDAMTAGVSTSGADPAYQYGLGVAIWTESPWGRSYGHRGWIPGYVSSLRYFPEHGVAIAFQVNTDIGVIAEERPVMLEVENRLAALVLAERSSR